MRAPTLLILVMAAGSSLVGCSDHKLNSLNDLSSEDPQIEVSPVRLEYGQLRTGEELTKTFTITSTGGSDLNVTDLRLGQNLGNYSILSESKNFYLPPGASQDVQVTFSPIGDAEQIDLVVVESNATNAPKASVDLYGVGAVPELEISPNPYDFGEVFIGCDATVDVTLTNVGSDILRISEITADGTDITHSWDLALPLTLDPGDSREVAVRFEPLEPSEYGGTISVTSNEPLGVREAVQSGVGRFVNEWSENFVVPEDPPSDIMFVVDQSCSMDDDQERLADNFNYFISNLNSYTTDWQIIVGNNSGGCNNAGEILTRTSDNYQNAFRQAVSSGNDTYIDDPERLLITASNGVENTDPGDCNSGFIREDALLHVVLVSDEREQSGDWSGYTTRILNKKGDLDLVKVSAIAGDVPSGCGTAEAGTGYWEATEASGGLFLSICETDWTAYMEELAYASIVLDTFDLENNPWLPSLEVFIDGEPAEAATWTYDEVDNSVIFATGYEPEGGSIVTVTYGENYSCD